MSSATITRERQADLLKQLEQAGISTTSTDETSLDALKSNSRLAKDVLEAMGQWKGAAYNFGSIRPSTGGRGK